MKNKFIKTIIIAVMSCGLALSPITSVFADSCSPDVCEQDYPASVQAACNCDGSSSSDDPLPPAIVNILNSIIFVLGIIAVIFIVVGGIGYMTSTGDPGKVKKAKDTILYACIGLVICALAFTITNFAIKTINSSTETPSSSDESGS